MSKRNTETFSSGRKSSSSETGDWVADFETTTDPEDCRVWAWGLTDIFAEEPFVEIDNSVDSFMDRCATMTARIYFHNLEFDGKFILDWLLRHGYEHNPNPRHKLYPGEFRTVISAMGKFYSITVQWSRYRRTEFRDSLKKLPMTVARIAKAFNMEIMKGEIDYNAPRPVGHIITPEERAYLENDVLIVAAALRQQLIAGMKKLTVGADSLYEYKKTFGTAFEKCFPILSDSMDAEIRRAYRGGWTYADPRYRGKIQYRPIRVYDVNSLYPSVMRHKLMPWGVPVWCDGEPEITQTHPLYITTVTLTAKIKPNHLPCIQLKNNRFVNAEYVTEIPEPTTLTCTNIDLRLWMDHYDIEILAWEGSWRFKGLHGAFDAYIDKWMNVKMTTKGGLREIAKLHLNSLYGKFATNPDVTPKVPIMDDNVVKYVKGDEERRNPVYTPMGVFITSYAREITIRAAQQNYETFAYADTDSLHLLTDRDPDNLNIDSVALGAWKFEGEYSAGIYVRAKCYTEWRDKCNCGSDPHERGCGYDTHIAGMPAHLARHVEFEDFWDGHEFDGKLVPRAVPGGVVLTPTSWKLSDESLPKRLAPTDDRV